MASGWSTQTGGFLEEAIAAARRADLPHLESRCLSALAVARAEYDPSGARALIDESLAIARRCGLHAAGGADQSILATLSLLEGDPRRAVEVLDEATATSNTLGLVTAAGVRACAALGAFDEALAAADRHHDLVRRTGVSREIYELTARALVAAATGQADLSMSNAHRALEIAVTARPHRAITIGCPVRCALAIGHIDHARQLVQEITDLSPSLEYRFTSAEASVVNARLMRHGGHIEVAEDAVHIALDQSTVLPAWMTAVDALETLAGIAADSQRYEQAARLMGCAAAIRDRTGYVPCLSERDTDIAALSASIDPESFEHVWEEGRALRIDEAVGYARRGRGERKRPTIGWASLIPTELQVVDLVQEGRTNAEIGERLFVSTRTVQAHLTRIYAKLGVAGRTQLAIQAGNVRS